MALETENGGNSGIDTIMRTLAEKRLIEDRSPTLDGLLDAADYGGAFGQRELCLFDNDSVFSFLRFNPNARQHVRRRHCPIDSAQP